MKAYTEARFRDEPEALYIDFELRVDPPEKLARFLQLFRSRDPRQRKRAYRCITYEPVCTGDVPQTRPVIDRLLEAAGFSQS